MNALCPPTGQLSNTIVCFLLRVIKPQPALVFLPELFPFEATPFGSNLNSSVFMG